MKTRRKASTGGRRSALRGMKLGLEQLEAKLLLDGAQGLAGLHLANDLEPSGGPLESQSQAWTGYDQAAVPAGAAADATQQVIADVPKYLWHHGCGPTAAGMVLGYWDMHGYPNLIDGNSSTQTSAVNQAIASTQHYNDYSKPIDDWNTGVLADKSSLGGAHKNNSIADWMRTSWSIDGMCYGWAYASNMDDAIDSYADWKGYSNFTATNEIWGDFTWEDFKTEIDAGRPMVFLVDTDANGSTDHFIPAIGYDDSLHLYACYNTWDTDTHWFDFAQMAQGQSWGILGATFVDPHVTTPTVGIGDVQFHESNAGKPKVNFSVTLSSASTQEVTVNFTTQDGTAIAGSDYATTGGTLTFKPGQTKKNVAVVVYGDKLHENDETFQVSLSDASGADIGQGVGTCTILDNDKPPTAAVNKFAAKEADAAATGAAFTVKLSAPSGLPVTVQYTTADGSATAGADYLAAGPTTLTFDPGVTSQTVTVPVLDETLFETNETFTVNLTTPEGATIAKGKGVGTATIVNDDAPPAVSIGNGTLVSGDTGSSVQFIVTLSEPSGVPAKVHFATASGTARAGTAFKSLSGTLTIDAGQTQQTILVPLLVDPASSAGKTFTVNLSKPKQATLGTPTRGYYTFETPQLATLVDALAAWRDSTSAASSQRDGQAVDAAILLMLTDVA